jgi:hypothetical protein
MLLQGSQSAFAVRQLNTLPCLGEAEFKVFSQFGEDGIIEWLVSRLSGIPRTFVEFGVEDYSESNTRFLLRNRNWRGLVIDGSAVNIDCIRRRNSFWKHDLTAVAAFIDRDNINGLLADNRFAGELGVLSIDVDGNDYWIWQAIKAVTPWIVVVEYNAVLGDLEALTIPYDPGFVRGRAHESNLYFGASIKALALLGETLGYSLVGSNRAGHNAFFVRNDLMQQIAGLIADGRPLPSLFRESRGADGCLTFACGEARREVIAELTFVDVVNGETRRLADVGEIYSRHWRDIMGSGGAKGVKDIDGMQSIREQKQP